MYILGHEIAGGVTPKHIYEIAKIKSQDSNFARVPLESVCKTIAGAARSLGITVVTSESETVNPPKS